jgi:pimeloyl-ACP methyl ester carboxylesterase
MKVGKTVKLIAGRPFMRRRLAKSLALTSPHAIDEEKYIPIGGIEQWVSIRGEDRANPVLLFAHGGPGATHTIFKATLRPWEKYFTIVQWDQRGSGKTMHKNGFAKPGELTLVQLEQDGIELTEYLLKLLDKEKILLVASSVGSTFGLAMAKHYPELFYGYVGTDQNTFPEGAAITYEKTIEWLRKSGNAKGVKAIEAIGPDHEHWTRQQVDQVAQWAAKANPNIPDMVMDVIFPAMITSPTHTIRDLKDILSGMTSSSELLFKELAGFDARNIGTDFAIPFFIFQGDSDIVTPTEEARRYFDMVRAPHKAFIPIKNSGHMAAFTRPGQFLDELLRHVRPLALQKSRLGTSVPR